MDPAEVFDELITKLQEKWAKLEGFDTAAAAETIKLPEEGDYPSAAPVDDVLDFVNEMQ